MDDYSAFDEAHGGGQRLKAFFTLDMNSPKEVKDWLSSCISQQKQRWMHDFYEMRLNLQAYEGIYYSGGDVDQRTQASNRNNPSGRKYKRIAVNHLRDFTEARTARLMKFRPAFDVLPQTNEFEDKVDARVSKKIVDALWNSAQIENLLIKAVRSADVVGESYIFTLWDANRGPQHPIAKMMPEKVEDPEGDGEDNQVDPRSVRIGDIDYRLYEAFHVFLDNKKRWEDVDWVITYDRESVDELKVRYPEEVDSIKTDSDVSEFDRDSDDFMEGNDASVYTFFHRPTHYLPKGRLIKFTKDVLLENVDYPFYQPGDDLPGMLPCIRLTADERPSKLRGVSLYRHLRPLQDHYNILTTMIMKGQILAAHPKWMVPFGSTKTENLGNDITVTQFKGPVAPALVSFSPNAPELFTFREQLKADLQQLSLVFGTSRGEPPAGIKAGVALQFLSEQENERFSLSVIRYQQSIRELVLKSILVVANKYDDSDERIIQAVGAGTGMDQEVMNFQVSQLKKRFNVTIQNGNALPESKAARMQTILDLSDRYPDQYSPDQVLEMIGMSPGEKFTDQASIANQSAESENERLLQMGISNERDGYQDAENTDPQDYENHIVHWKTHYKILQEQRFKHLPQEAQDRMIDHIRAHEYFMIEKTSESVAYGQLIQALPQFPLFFKVSKPMNATPTPGQVDPAIGATMEGEINGSISGDLGIGSGEVGVKAGGEFAGL